MDTKVLEIKQKIENARSYLEDVPVAIEYCKYDIGRQRNTIEILKRTTCSDAKSMFPTIAQCEKIIERRERFLNEWIAEQQEVEQRIQDLLKELSEHQD